MERALENAADENSSYIAVINSTLTRNSANISGGAIFTNDADLLAVCCKCKFEVEEANLVAFGVTNVERPGQNITERPNSCEDHWVGNRALMEEGHDLFATTVTTACLCYSVENCENCTESYLIPDYRGGDELAPIRIKLMDAFHQVAFGDEEISVDLDPDLKTVIMSDEVTFKLAAETNITGIRLKGKIGTTRKLMLKFRPDFIPSLEVSVQLRDCIAGEELGQDKDTCNFCVNGSYSFSNSSNCRNCPADATCRGSTVTPDDNFWHYSSQSIRIRECLVKEACANETRSETLRRQAEHAHALNNILHYSDNDKYNQCAPVRKQHLYHSTVQCRAS